ncbi:MAG: DUF58 domain-containing protein [Nitrososphaerota archaeon]|nr:DUF58 domain-containing protein [Nitrososphaerota archaeon]
MLLASALALAFSTILFRDVVILVAFLLAVAVVLSEFLWVCFVTRNPARWITFTRTDSSEKKALYPGEVSSSTYALTRRTRDEIRLSSGLPYLKIEPHVMKSSETTRAIQVDFATPFSGEYVARGLDLSVLGPMKLFEGNCLLPLSIRYVVFPKVIQVAITTARILGKSGIGETPINTPGPGTEFYELREYQVGDDYRHINWKATARRNEFMVNDRMREVGGSCYLVLDSRVAEYSEKDRLASTFLHVANTLTILRTRFGVVIHDGEKITGLKRIDVPETALGFALTVALEFAGLEKKDLPEEIVPLASHFLRSNQNLLATNGFGLLSEIEHSGRLNLRNSLNASTPLREVISLGQENESEPPAVLYFSALHGSVNPVLEAASDVRRGYHGEFTLIAPTMPWVASLGEGEAYRAYTEFYEKIMAFESSGINCFAGEPTAIVRNLFEHR